MKLSPVVEPQEAGPQCTLSPIGLSLQRSNAPIGPKSSLDQKNAFWSVLQQFLLHFSFQAVVAADWCEEK